MSIEEIDPNHLRFVFKRMDKKYQDECLLLLTSERIYNYSSKDTDDRIKRLFSDFIQMTDDDLVEHFYDEYAEYWREKTMLQGFISVIKEYFSLRGFVLEDHPEWLI